MFSFSLIPVITKPTRITDHSQTLIDNFFLINPSNIFASSLCADISDHFPIVLICRGVFNVKPHRDNIKVKYRLINDSTLAELYNVLYSINLDYILQLDVDAAVKRIR